MKTLYLHIGTPKTASSSIQTFCRINRHRLRKYGYTFPMLLPKYPNVRLERNAHFLVEASPKYDMSYVGEGVKTETSDEVNARQRHLSGGLKTIHKAFDKYSNVILSDESLWLSLNYSQRSPLEILYEDAKTYEYQIKVIVYLRRQDQFLVSQWKSRIKGAGSSQTFSEYLNDIMSRRPLILDYASSLERISDVIGKENVIVRPFEPSAWADGSVYMDFLNAIGFMHSNSLKQLKKKVNIGLTANYAEILRQINAQEEISRERKTFLGDVLIRTSRERPEHSEYGLFSAEETKELLAKYEEGNIRIAEDYLGKEGSIFSEEVKELEKWTQDNEYMEEDMSYYLSLISGAALGSGTWKYKCRHFAKELIQKALSFYK